MTGLVGLVMVAIPFTAAPVRAAITYETVLVGDPGNPNDSTGYGGVNYLYEIGKYNVTIGQYTAFLNAVAQTDTYSLYNASMGTNLNIAGISRTGSSGSYVYSVMNNGGSSANRPITYVSWFDAARFANWMANGQPTGAQSATTTENGAYNLITAAPGTAPAKNGTNPNTGKVPAFWIPTENEWYKAAYYQPMASGGPSDGYWAYATKSDAAPGNAIGPSANQANYYTGAGYSVTQSGSYSSSQNYLTDVGAFTGSASYYGTFDQSGNVYQWNDLNDASGSSRGLRGGNWSDGNAFNLSSSNRLSNGPSYENRSIGFRLASVPEPSTYAMALAGLACGGFSMWRRRKRA